MTTALAQIQEEIAKLEERLKLLRLAETALHALEKGITVTLQAPESSSPSNLPSRGLAGAVRDLLGKNGPMTKADIDRALSEGKWSLPKGGVSGALQAMKARGVVARTKAGKWSVR